MAKKWIFDELMDGGGGYGAVHVCAVACAGRGRECRGGDLTRSGGAYARRGGASGACGMAHTARFLERVDALLDQPKEVTRTEMMV
jgi:hypothetical protein